MANAIVRVHLKIRWWVMPYLRLCRLVAASGIAIDLRRVKENVVRGLRVRYRGSFRSCTPSG